jgi:hypothetical protein
MADDITSVEQLKDRYSKVRERLSNASELFEKRTALVLSRLPSRGGFSRVRLLLDIIAEVFEVPVATILSQRRDTETVQPRQLAMAITVEVFRISYPQTGEQLGGRDHTTVLHAHRKYKELIKKLMAERKMTNPELEAAERAIARERCGIGPCPNQACACRALAHAALLAAEKARWPLLNEAVIRLGRIGRETESAKRMIEEGMNTEGLGTEFEEARG